MSDIRDEKQKEAKEAFLATNHKAAIIGGTGVGKSKVAIDIVKDLGILEQEGLKLLLVSAERLRDNDWKENFSKFDADWNVIVPECYQTAYKWTGRHFKLVIADEFDFALTPEYSKFFANNTFDVLIALTAYIPEDKQELAKSIAPTCFQYSTQEAQEDGLLNKTRFVQINFDIGWDKTIKIPMKAEGKFFMQSENGNYLYLEEEIQKGIIVRSQADKKVSTAALMNIDTTEVDKKLAKASARLDFLIRKRMSFLHSLQSSERVAKELIAQILAKDKDNKVLVFSKLTAQSDKIVAHTYHTKNKKDNTNIQKLDSGEIRALGLCEAINRGANLIGVNHIIQESYVGSDTDFQQKHGRGVRLKPDEVMTYFILLPHYWAKVATELVTKTGKSVTYKWVRFPTQAKKWLENMTSKFRYEPELIDIAKDGKVPPI